MAKKIIYSATFTDLRPVIWYSTPVYERYQQLYNLLNDGLGKNYAEFLAEPIVKGNTISWLSDYLENPTELSQISPQEQENLRTQIQKTISEIQDYAKVLKSSPDPHQKELGELLEMSVEVPGLEYVMTDNTKVTLVAWGFVNEKSFKENFKLDAKISKPISNDSQNTFAEVSNSSTDNSSQQSATFADSNAQSSTIPNTENSAANIATNVANATPQNNNPVPTNSEASSSNEQKPKKSLPAWLWFVFGFLTASIISTIIVMSIYSEYKPIIDLINENPAIIELINNPAVRELINNPSLLNNLPINLFP